MIRRGLFILFASLLLLVVWAVRGFDPSNRPTDEILAYEVKANSAVEVMLHGGVSDVSITSWLVLPFSETGTGPYPYALQAEFFNSKGLRVHSRTVESVGRLPQAGDAPTAQRARLSDGKASVCEARTSHLDASSLQGHAGRLRITPIAGKFSHLLLRLAHRVQRSAFEQRLMARTLSPTARARLTAERTSLGYFDIPAAIRTEALSYWQRRLSAAGREGRDYFVRRLLLHDKQSASQADGWNGRHLSVSARHGLSYNISAGTSLRVHSRTATRLWLRTTGSDAASFHDIKPGVTVELQLTDQGLTTATLTADPAADLNVSAAIDEAKNFLNGENFALVQSRLEVLPDFRRAPIYRLHDEEPIVIGLAPQQNELGLSFRRLQETADAEPSPQWSRVVFLDSAHRSLSETKMKLQFSGSLFEQVDGSPASESTPIILHRPSDAVLAEIYGPSHLLVVAFVSDPDFDELRYRPPYDIVLPEALRFRFAPPQMPRRAVLRPNNAEALRAENRLQYVTAQVRLEHRDQSSQRIAPRVLQPQGNPKRRHAFSPSTFSRQYPFPDNGWVLFSSKRFSRRLRAVKGRDSISLWYRADPERLGSPWSLALGSEVLLEETLSFLSGDRNLVLPDLPGELKVTGLGKTGLLLAHAEPIEGGRFMKRQQMYALAAGDSLQFEFQKKTNELLTVALGVLTTDGNAPLLLEHQIDSGTRPNSLSHYRKRPTVWRGEHHSRTGDRGRALLWSARAHPSAEALRDRLGGLYLQLGDDLPTGPHRLTIRNIASDFAPGGNQTWIRAVLVGRALSSQ